MLRNPKTRYVAIGSIAFFLFGLTLAVIGGRLIFYQYLLSTHGRKVVGEITEAGTFHRSSGVNSGFIKYSFIDSSGRYRSGRSSGYSGEVGETVLLEYVPSYPFVHRVSGEGNRISYRWRWMICISGCIFGMAGIHWGIVTNRRILLAERLGKNGIAVVGRVMQIADGGRTIVYEYAIESEKYKGKTFAMPLETVKKFKPNDRVDLYVDPLSHRKSVLKIEFDESIT